MEILYFTVVGPATGSVQRPLADRLSGQPGRGIEERRANAALLAQVVVDGLIAPAADDDSRPSSS